MTAEELALLVKSVLERTPEIKRRALVLAGGVLENDEILTQKLKQILTVKHPDLVISSPKGSALEGACMLAISTLTGEQTGTSSAPVYNSFDRR